METKGKIGIRIAEMRKRKNMSQLKLASAVGMNYQQLSAIERGVHSPQISTLERLAEALGCRIDLISDEKQ
jgi:transcriptional regulator with XRE-family HTH domain